MLRCWKGNIRICHFEKPACKLVIKDLRANPPLRQTFMLSHTLIKQNSLRATRGSNSTQHTAGLFMGVQRMTRSTPPRFKKRRFKYIMCLALLSSWFCQWTPVQHDTGSCQIGGLKGLVGRQQGQVVGICWRLNCFGDQLSGSSWP